MKKKSIKSSFRKKTKKRCKIGGANNFYTNNLSKIIPLEHAIEEVNQIGQDLIKKKEWIEFIYKNRNLMLVVGGIVISSMAITILKQHRNISRHKKDISQSKVQIKTLENNLNTTKIEFNKLEKELNKINRNVFNMIGYGIMNFNTTNNLCELTPTQKYHNCICYKH